MHARKVSFKNKKKKEDSIRVILFYVKNIYAIVFFISAISFSRCSTFDFKVET